MSIVGSFRWGSQSCELYSYDYKEDEGYECGYCIEG